MPGTAISRRGTPTGFSRQQGKVGAVVIRRYNEPFSRLFGKGGHGGRRHKVVTSSTKSLNFQPWPPGHVRRREPGVNRIARPERSQLGPTRVASPGAARNVGDELVTHWSRPPRTAPAPTEHAGSVLRGPNSPRLKCNKGAYRQTIERISDRDRPSLTKEWV